MNHQVVSGNGESRSSAFSSSVIEGLVDALVSEKRLIEELNTIMLRQREAVAADDLQSVDDSVYSVQRVLFTLGEARKRRRAINERLGFEADIPLRELLESLGARATDTLRTAREGLQTAARALSREVSVNRQVLREALAEGDEYVRALTGAVTGNVAGYPPGAGTAPDRRTTSFLVNRQA